MKRLGITALACFGLVGCETNSGPYVRIGPGPDLAYAEAQCNILAMQTEQGVIAWGSPSYVAGAELGNAIGNAVRAEVFKKNCMTMQGWARGPSAQQQKALARESRIGRERQAKAIAAAKAKGQEFPPPPQ